jgi:hypothetical protein
LGGKEVLVMAGLAQHNSDIVLAPSRMNGSAGASSDGIHPGAVYRTALLACLIGAPAALIGGGLSGVIGFAYGAALALVSMRTIELTVRRLFCPEVRMARVWFGALVTLKFLLLAVLLTGAVWLATLGLVNLYAVVAGVALVHAVILMKAVEAWLLEALPPKRVAESEQRAAAASMTGPGPRVPGPGCATRAKRSAKGSRGGFYSRTAHPSR